MGSAVAGAASGRGLVTGLTTGATRPSVRKPAGEGAPAEERGAGDAPLERACCEQGEPPAERLERLL